MLPWISPSSPRVAFWTMGGVGRLAKTISAASPTAAGDAAALAPRAVRAATAAALVSKTVRLWPASSSRPAIKPPIRPTPMNPRCEPATPASCHPMCQIEANYPTGWRRHAMPVIGITAFRNSAIPGR